MHCHTLDERDALLLREAADEANFCSSSMARQMQAALFKSDTLLCVLQHKPRPHAHPLPPLTHYPLCQLFALAGVARLTI